MVYIIDMLIKAYRKYYYW